MSFSSMDCLAYGNKVFRTGDPPWMASTSLTGATIMVFFRPGLVAFLLRAKGESKSRSHRPVHTVSRRLTTGDCCRSYNKIRREAGAPASSSLSATKGARVGSRTCHPLPAYGELHPPTAALREVFRPA